MSALTLPRISIVTPSYNQGAYIEQTLRSVLDQDYPNLEYIVIDGGSTDGSADIIRSVSGRLAYWVSEKDNGAAHALQKGFACATGDIVAYLNSDDIYLPGALHAVAETWQRTGADVVYGNTYWIDVDGRRVGERRQTQFHPMGYLYGGSDLQQPATFWTRDLYQRAGGIDPTYTFAFDTDLFVRFVRSGARFAHVNRFLASFRIHPSSKSSTQVDRCEAELERLRQNLPFPYRSLRATCVRNLARAHRALWYLLQGDLPWLIRRIPDRVLSMRSQEIAGPRAKWM